MASEYLQFRAYGLSAIRINSNTNSAIGFPTETEKIVDKTWITRLEFQYVPETRGDFEEGAMVWKMFMRISQPATSVINAEIFLDEIRIGDDIESMYGTTDDVWTALAIIFSGINLPLIKTIENSSRYILDKSDNGKTLLLNYDSEDVVGEGMSPYTIGIPNGLPLDFVCKVVRMNNTNNWKVQAWGDIETPSSINVLAASGNIYFRTQYSVIYIQNIGNDNFVVSGDTTD